eukprot:14908512-Heterocapsa_arctica.AAC.1
MARPAKRKLVPREVVPEYDGPPLTGSQELRRLFATKPAGRPLATQEEFPRLTRAKAGPGKQEAAVVPQEEFILGTRPRSRSPRTSAWVGAEGKHLEAARVVGS